MPNRTEEEFIKAVSEDADRDSYNLEMAAKEVSQLTGQAFRIFKAIAENADLKDQSNLLQIQTALHERMIATLCHIGRNCLLLLEAQVDFAKQDDLESYLQSLKKKHALDAEQMMLVSLAWHSDEESIICNLFEQEYLLQVFPEKSQELCSKYTIETRKTFWWLLIGIPHQTG